MINLVTSYVLMFFLASITSCRYLLLSNMYGGLCLSYLLWSKVNDITLIFNLKNLHTIQTTHSGLILVYYLGNSLWKIRAELFMLNLVMSGRLNSQLFFLSLLLKLIFFPVLFCVSLWIDSFIYLQDCYLVYILTEMTGSTSMIFTRTCEATRLLALLLRELGFKSIPISGQMSQVFYFLQP